MHGKSAQNRVCAVECLPTLAQTMGEVMGSELVGVQNGKVPVNVINVHDTPLQVYKGKTLGSLHPVKHISTIRSDQRNSRRKSKRYSKILTVADIPEHTRAVLDGADELTVEQTSEVCELILEDTDRFVKKDGKTGNRLGRTWC